MHFFLQKYSIFWGNAFPFSSQGNFCQKQLKPTKIFIPGFPKGLPVIGLFDVLVAAVQQLPDLKVEALQRFGGQKASAELDGKMFVRHKFKIFHRKKWSERKIFLRIFVYDKHYHLVLNISKK